MVRNRPGRMCTALPARSVPSVEAVKASSGTVARSATMHRSAASRSKEYSAALGCRFAGMVWSVLGIGPRPLDQP